MIKNIIFPSNIINTKHINIIRLASLIKITSPSALYIYTLINPQITPDMNRKRLKPKKAILTHMGHWLDYDELNAKCPKNVEPGVDGMHFTLES